MLPIVCSTYADVSKGKEYVDMLVAKQVDGLIVLPLGLVQAEEDRVMKFIPSTIPIPTVLVDRPGEPGYTVLLDSEGAGYKATKHLLEHGHRQIGIISCRLDVPALYEAYLGYNRALREAGLEESKTIAEAENFSFDAGYHAFQKLWENPSPPTAIFASGDLLAIGAMRAIRDRGLRIPEDLAIVGYTNIPLSAYADPPLTTVHAPAQKMGQESMKILCQLIRREPIGDQKITLPTKLIIRRSCGCPSGHDGDLHPQP
jgi:DNA-binding LacI/PurR family transcriptional regulator